MSESNANQFKQMEETIARIAELGAQAEDSLANTGGFTAARFQHVAVRVLQELKARFDALSQSMSPVPRPASPSLAEDAAIARSVVAQAEVDELTLALAAERAKVSTLEEKLKVAEARVEEFEEQERRLKRRKSSYDLQTPLSHQASPLHASSSSLVSFTTPVQTASSSTAVLPDVVETVPLTQSPLAAAALDFLVHDDGDKEPDFESLKAQIVGALSQASRAKTYAQNMQTWTKYVGNEKWCMLSYFRSVKATEVDDVGQRCRRCVRSDSKDAGPRAVCGYIVEQRDDKFVVKLRQ